MKLDTLLDPRGHQEREVIELTRKVTLDKLRNGRILFYNNTKLGFCNYYTVFGWIKKYFTELGITNFVEYTKTVKGKDTKKLYEYASVLAKEKPMAVIVAFGDMDISSSTTVVTTTLEKLRIPTVYMTAPPGAAIAEGVGVYRADHLCLCSVDVYQASTVEEVAAQVGLKWEYTISSLTSNGDQLEKLAYIDFKVDKVAPAGSGLLPLELGANEEQSHEPGACMEEVNAHFNEMHISGGLPIIPPTRGRYEVMMEYCPYAEDMVLCDASDPSGRIVMVRDVAVAAIMAGCIPKSVPALTAAFRALNSPLYNLNQSVTTSHPGGNLVLVSGPITQEIGISGKQGCQGPGWPMNAIIGRAVDLVMMNVFCSVPGVCDLDCIALQTKFTYCFAEEPDVAQWNMINEDHYDKDTTTVYVLKAEPIHDIIDFLSLDGYDLLDTITACCITLDSGNACMPGPMIVCLIPDHAMMLRKVEFTKEMVQEHIYTYAHHKAPMVKDRGLVPVRPASFKNKHPIPVTRSPRDVEVVTIGGRGGRSGVILPWTLYSEGCIKPIALPDGTIARSIEEFKQS